MCNWRACKRRRIGRAHLQACGPPVEGDGHWMAAGAVVTRLRQRDETRAKDDATEEKYLED